jgi:hypothetical protein
VRRALALRALALLALGLLTGGCGPTLRGGPAGSPDSPSASASAAERSRVSAAERGHEYPAATAPAPQHVPTASPGPAAAVRAFATAYINWTAATVTARLRTLATLSVGQARTAMTLAAGQTARDYELRRGGVANRGTVEAVSPLSGSATRYVVVTRERTTATATDAYQGLKPAWHVALASVVRVPGGGWALSGWQPEN